MNEIPAGARYGAMMGCAMVLLNSPWAVTRPVFGGILMSFHAACFAEHEAMHKAWHSG